MEFYGSTPLTRHLTPKQIAGIETALICVPDSRVDALVTNLLGEAPFTRGFWEEFPGVCYTNWPLVAFKALKARRISEAAFATISLLSAMCGELAYNRMDVEIVDNSAGGAAYVSPSSTRLPNSHPVFTVISPKSPEYVRYFDHFANLFLEQGRRTLQTQVAKLPFHDQQLFVFRLPPGAVKKWSPMLDLMNRAILSGSSADWMINPIETTTGFSVKRELVVCSMAVYELYLRHFGANDMLRQRLVPVLGGLTVNEMAEYQSKFTSPFRVAIPKVVPHSALAGGRYVGEGTFTLESLYVAHFSQFRTYRSWAALNRVVFLLSQLPPEVRESTDIVDLRLILSQYEGLITTSHLGERGTISMIFLGRNIKGYWDRNPDVKRLVFSDMAAHQDFWHPILEESPLNSEDSAFLDDIKSSDLPPDEPLPMDMDAHFGFPAGFINRMERCVIQLESPIVMANGRIRVLHHLHFNGPEAVDNIEKWMAILPTDIRLSYPDFLRLAGVGCVHHSITTDGIFQILGQVPEIDW